MIGELGEIGRGQVRQRILHPAPDAKREPPWGNGQPGSC
jgi:hypothetical protein